MDDHLGSAALSLSADGTPGAELRYTSFGETRSSQGELPTAYRYTGQLAEPLSGLYYYNARWYDPALPLFIQPDTLVPNLNNPLDWNRYAYVRYNPLRYTDPTGHKACSNDGNSFDSCLDPLSTSMEELARNFNISFEGNWSERNKAIAYIAAYDNGVAFSKVLGGSPSEAFTRVNQKGIKLTWGTSGAQNYCFSNGEFTAGGCANSATSINFVSLSEETISGGGYMTGIDAFISARNNVVHEFGHSFASLWYKNGIYSDDGPYGSGKIPVDLVKNQDGFIILPAPNHRTWRQNPALSNTEIFADMYLGWVYNNWDRTKEKGNQRARFMDINMRSWIISITSKK